jgi:predicted  nucleic acid-binding Zn-ribbon protein
MTDTSLLLSRLALLSQIQAKIDLNENLRNRVIQRTAELLALATEGADELKKAISTSVLERNTSRIEKSAAASTRMGGQIAKISKRFEKAKNDIPTAPPGRIDRVLNRSLGAYERVQALLELQLLELDAIFDEIEDAIGKPIKPKGN